MKALYETQVTATGGREGVAESNDGNLKVKLSIPKSLGGPGLAGATNPEQLFAAGYSACFESAIQLIARGQKVTIESLAVKATVGLTKAPTGFALLVALHVTLTGPDAAKANEIVQAAHQVCPYSNATRNNVDVQISVN